MFQVEFAIIRAVAMRQRGTRKNSIITVRMELFNTK